MQCPRSNVFKELAYFIQAYNKKGASNDRVTLQIALVVPKWCPRSFECYMNISLHHRKRCDFWAKQHILIDLKRPSVAVWDSDHPSKSVCGQPHVGSNPTRCAKKRTAPPQGGAVLLSGWDSKPERVSGVKKTCRWHVFSREVRSSYAAKTQKPLLSATANAVSSFPRLQNTICKCIMNYNLCLI